MPESPPRSPSSRASQRSGFSLVELVLAIGIVSFAFLALFALVPAGLTTFRQTMNTTIGSQIVHRIINEAQQTDYPALISAPLSERYFDDQGNEVQTIENSVYTAQVTVTAPTTLPNTSTPDSTSLATVVVKLASNPGHHPSPFDADESDLLLDVFGADCQESVASEVMKRCPVHRGFTLVELLLSVALIALLVVILAAMTNATAFSWRYTSAKIEQFRGAETAFETISRRLSQATLNTSWDYQYPNGNASLQPDSYVRQSDLRFIAGRTETLMGSGTPRRPTHGIFFQAPLGFVDDPVNFGGLDNLLNTWGYYLEYNKDVRPPFLDTLPHPPPPRVRWRLMELMQPSNELTIYSRTSGNPSYTGHEWFTDAFGATAPPVHVLAENIIAMVLLPQLSKAEDPSGIKLAPNYNYDSTYDLVAANPSESGAESKESIASGSANHPRRD